MSVFEEIDKLVDKTLNGEATEKEQIHLESLCAANDENLDYYFKAIDEQVTFRDVLSKPTQDLTPNSSSQKISKFPLWPLISLIIFAGLIYLSMQRLSASTSYQLKILPRSHDISVIRHQGELTKTANLTLQKDDLINVGREGELWIKTDSGTTLFIKSDSMVKINQNSQESLTLNKGEIYCLSQDSEPFIFNTSDSEIRLTDGKIKVSYSQGTTAKLLNGKAVLTRLKDGKNSIIEEQSSINSLTFNKAPLTSQDLKTFFPNIQKGIRYFYHEKSSENSESFQIGKEIDRGLTNNLKVRRGEHEGYARYEHDKHSHIHKKDFIMTFRALIKIEESDSYTFQISGYAKTQLTLHNETITSKGNNQEELKIFLEKGLHSVEVKTVGIVEDDTDGHSMRVKMKNQSSDFQDISELYYTDFHPLPEIFTDHNINRKMPAHLPLKGSYLDTVNNLEAAPEGEPQFTLDEKYGPVLKMDGKDDHLVHFPVDQLG